jgi:RND family efflux transporter MFP subunit
MAKYLATLLLLVAGLAYWMGWVPWAQPLKTDKAPPTVLAKRMDIAPVLPLSGEVAPAFQVDVKPEIGGKIKKIHVIAGQNVRKGESLVTIDDTDLLNERASAEAEISGARLRVEKILGNFSRAKQLFAQKLLSREEYVNLEADYQIAENELAKSLFRRQTVDDRLAKTRVVSPADGTILDVPVNEGQVVVGAASVNSGTNLMSFADLSRLLINAHVNQLDAGKLSVGQLMEVHSPDSSDQDYQARIEFIAPLATVKNNIKGFEVRGVIEGNRESMRPGVSVSIIVPIGKAEGVVSLPVTAVFERDRKTVVYVLKGKETECRDVVVGLMDSSHVEIKSGLVEGEEVLMVAPPDPASPKKKKM